jgi:hypothetical protein
MSSPISSPLLAPGPAWAADALSLYLRLVPPEFCEQLRQQQNIRENNRVYSTPVVIWLMMAQRLQGNSSLESAVLEIVRGLPSHFWPRPCKRLRDRSHLPAALSTHTGAYNQARQGLPVSMVEACCDRIFEQLIAAAPGALPPWGQRVFFLDGTTLRMPHSEPLLQLFPPTANQHGPSHWPVLRMLVAHDLQTGLAMRPQWGAVNGREAVSEQELLERAIDRLPGGAIVLGDANFGVFSVAYAADQRRHPLLLRLTPVRAQHLAGRPIEEEMDLFVTWKPTREERRRHPDFPPEAQVAGRLLVRRVQPSNGEPPFLLPVFTTLEGTAEQIIPIYGQRWHIETDLRSLKCTLRLDQLTCSTAEMVAKEIDLALAAYNLVRAGIYLAAQEAGTAPRDYGFTRAKNVILALAPLIAAAKTRAEAQLQFERMMFCLRQARKPKRNRKRPSYPRKVWSRGERYPSRKA